MIVVITCGHKPDDERIYGREIQSLLNAGYEVTYFTRWDGNIYLSQDGLFHRNYSKKNLSVQSYIQSVGNDLKVLKPKVIHIHEFELLPLAKRIKKKLGAKVIYDSHEANIELWDAFSSKPLPIKKIINWSLLRFEKRYLPSVDYVFTTSPVLVERYQNWGAEAVYIPNYPILFPMKIEKEEPPKIIYHGQISQERGMEDLIRAIQPLVNAELEFQVEIYGTERIVGTIVKFNQLIKELNLDDVVKIHEQIPHQDMLKILSKAKIAVIPFHDLPMFQVAVPVKMLEAMWADCAVVASELKLMQEYGDGFVQFFPSGDVDALSKILEKLIIDEEFRNDIAKAGKSKIKSEYNWSLIEPRILEIYNRILA